MIMDKSSRALSERIQIQMFNRLSDEIDICELFYYCLPIIISLVEKYGTYTTVNGHIRAVYAPYFQRNPGRCFTTVCNENKACIRPYTAQNAVLYAVP